MRAIFHLNGTALQNEQDANSIRSHFQNISNKVVNINGKEQIEILDNNIIYKIDLTNIEDKYYVLMINDSENKIKLTANIEKESDKLRLDLTKFNQIKLENTELIYRILLKAAEVIARGNDVNEIMLTTQVKNINLITTAFEYGFRLTSVDESTTSKKLCFKKNFLQKPLPSDNEYYLERFFNGSLEVVPDAIAVLKTNENEIAITIPSNSNYVYDLCSKLCKNDYIGIGYIKTSADTNDSILVFKHKNSMLSTKSTSLDISVKSDYDRLNEVITSYNPQVLSLTSQFNSNNKVSNATNGYIDVISYIEEHDRFFAILKNQGISVLRSGAWDPDPQKSGIFSRDPAFSIGDNLVIGKMKVDNRKYESNAIEKIVPKSSILRIDENDAIIEGGDIIYLGEKTVVVGLGQRTNKKGLENLARLFPEHNFIGVEHNDLHLDVLFTVVGKKKVLADITKLPIDFILWLQKENYDIIVADQEEQISLGCNVLAIDDNKVIAVKENTKTNQKLKEAGVTVIEVSMPNIIKLGGGPRCMTCPTNRS